MALIVPAFDEADDESYDAITKLFMAPEEIGSASCPTLMSQRLSRILANDGVARWVLNKSVGKSQHLARRQ